MSTTPTPAPSPPGPWILHEGLALLFVAGGVVLVLIILIVVFCLIHNKRKSGQSGNRESVRRVTGVGENTPLISETNLKRISFHQPPPSLSQQASKRHRVHLERNFNEEELRAKKYTRGTSFQFNSNIFSIGHPEGKGYFSVTSNGGQNCVLITGSVLQTYCPYPITDEATVNNFVSVMTGINHPNIMPCLKAGFSVDTQTAFIFRSWSPTGSLLDVMHKTNPEKPYREKYHGKLKPLTPDKLALYGRHILQGLNALRSAHFPYPQLSATNVIIDKNVARLADLEDTFLGRTPIYKHQGLTMRPEVFQFGLLLLEMATGTKADERFLFNHATDPEMGEEESDGILRDYVVSRKGSSAAIISAIQQIFAPQSEATIDDLLEDPLFKPKGKSKGEEPDSPSKVASKAVKQICKEVLTGIVAIDDGNTVPRATSFAKQVDV